jgi:hypothetical protein
VFEEGGFGEAEGAGFGLDLGEFVEMAESLLAMHFLVYYFVADEYVLVHGRY